MWQISFIARAFKISKPEETTVVVEIVSASGNARVIRMKKLQRWGVVVYC